MSNGHLCYINSLLYTADTLSSYSYALFLQKKDKINKFCILSVINQIQDEAFNINDNFWVNFTLQGNKKLYITHLQYSYLIQLYFQCDIRYLKNGCEANAITFVHPSNNKLNVEPIIDTSEYKLGFNRSYSKINKFSLMQSPNIWSLTDNRLEALANKIPEMKRVHFQ